MNHVPNMLGLALAGIFTNGLWAGKARDGCPAPYGVLLYFGETNQYLSGEASDQNSQVQLDCWAATVDEVETLADSVEAAMIAHDINASPTMFTSTSLSREFMEQDPNVKLHRIKLEFSLWYRP